MTIEQSSVVGRRARLHGVLSDPGRLMVVDLLCQSDRSPSDLARRLGISSNLLAHHVGVLVEHGLVRRTRSEGDHRRTYLSLIPDALSELGMFGSGSLTPERVLFVCTANSARSQLAAALWSATSSLPAASAGTRPARQVAPGAVRAARRHRLTGLGAPRALGEVHLAGDLVVTVCDRAHEEMGDLADRHWSVPDPVPAGDDGVFDEVVAELERRVTDLTAHLSLPDGP